MTGKRLIPYRKAHTKAPPKIRARINKRNPLKANATMWAKKAAKLLKPIKRRHKTKGGRNSDPKKLAWLRTLPCAVRALATCGGVTEVHHDRPGGARATDKLTVPLCTTHHRTGSHSVEQLGRQGFQSFHGIGLDGHCAWYETEWLIEKISRHGL